jgi:phage terminase large subunit-like protein
MVDRTLKTGVADCIDTVWVQATERQHGAPCTSTLQFKAYDQGRLAFQGTSKHLIWLDEEPPDATETSRAAAARRAATATSTPSACCARRRPTGIIATFTPLRGLTPFVDHYLETAEMADASGLLVNAKRGLFGEEAA